MLDPRLTLGHMIALRAIDVGMRDQHLIVKSRPRLC
jgi:hypothetical protein